MIEVTALILTYNERENIERTLAALSWASKVVIIDSGSIDGTLEVAQAINRCAHFVHRPFDDHTSQWNFGLDQVGTDWVLSLDADYEVTPELVAEIQSLDLSGPIVAYRAPFQFRIHGRTLRTSVYPPRLVLFRKANARYREDGHTQTLEVDGRTSSLRGQIIHDDRKPLSRWIHSQDRYAEIEARHLLAQPLESLTAQDRLRRRIFFAPIVMFIYLLIGRGLLLDGWPGWYYVFQRTLAEMLLSLRLITEREGLEKSR
jgi:glycosyltransferase involved in cell wall biosynthesis